MMDEIKKLEREIESMETDLEMLHHRIAEKRRVLAQVRLEKRKEDKENAR